MPSNHNLWAGIAFKPSLRYWQHHSTAALLSNCGQGAGPDTTLPLERHCPSHGSVALSHQQPMFGSASLSGNPISHSVFNGVTTFPPRKQRLLDMCSTHCAIHIHQRVSTPSPNVFTWTRISGSCSGGTGVGRGHRELRNPNETGCAADTF